MEKLGKFAFPVNTEVLNKVLNKSRVGDRENLFPMWLVILDIVSETPYSYETVGRKL